MSTCSCASLDLLLILFENENFMKIATKVFHRTVILYICVYEGTIINAMCNIKSPIAAAAAVSKAFTRVMDPGIHNTRRFPFQLFAH